MRNAEGDLTTPSVVFFDRTGTLVGKEAVLAAEHEPERIARFAKRDMGEDEFAKPIRGEKLPPEVVQAIILRKLRDDAVRQIGEFTRAVITVPAYFNEPRRKATQDAARLAGIELLDIVNEPTAAAITYGIQQGFLNERGESAKRELVLVYDLGGGTFDCTLMEIDGRSYDCLGTLGEMRLGGIDWDRRLVDHLAELHVAANPDAPDPRKDDRGYEMLLHRAVEAKHALSTRPEANVQLQHDGVGGRFTVTRETIDALTADLVARTIDSVRGLLRATGRAWSDLTQLVLVGGSTRMPMIHEALERESGLTVDRSLSPDEAIAHGAAVYAGLLLREERAEDAEPSDRSISVKNVNSHDLGIVGKNPNTGERTHRVIIPRNTPLPCSRTEQSQTAKFDQRSVRVQVVEGSDTDGTGTTPIGRCVVRDLPPELPAGTAVDVEFTYERNGRLVVNASLPSIDRSATLDLERAAGLSEESIATWLARIEEGMTDAGMPGGGVTADPPAVPVVVPVAVESVEPAAPTVTTSKPKLVKKLKKLSNPTTPAAAPKPVKKLKKLGPSPAVEEPALEETAAKPDWRSRAKKLGDDEQ